MEGPSIAYFLFRITLGLNMLMHGCVRVFGNYRGFAESLAEQFRETPLPEWSVLSFGYALPVAEGVIGMFLILGFQTKKALMAGALLMMPLIFGMSLREQWSVVGTQMLYALIYFILLERLPKNTLALDNYLFDQSHRIGF